MDWPCNELGHARSRSITPAKTGVVSMDRTCHPSVPFMENEYESLSRRSHADRSYTGLQGKATSLKDPAESADNSGLALQRSWCLRH